MTESILQHTFYSKMFSNLQTQFLKIYLIFQEITQSNSDCFRLLENVRMSLLPWYNIVVVNKINHVNSNICTIINCTNCRSHCIQNNISDCNFSHELERYCQLEIFSQHLSETLKIMTPEISSLTLSSKVADNIFLGML